MKDLSEILVAGLARGVLLKSYPRLPCALDLEDHLLGYGDVNYTQNELSSAPVYY